MKPTRVRVSDGRALKLAPRVAVKSEPVPPLVNGAKLGAEEFLRRYDAMPDVKKAELIDGVVYLMTSPVSIEKHSAPDSLVHFWLNYYAMKTPGVEPLSNGTVCLGPVDIPQPDAALWLLPEAGGKSGLTDRDFLQGPPELVVEISASSVSIDLGVKMDMYRRSGAAEYVVWLTKARTIEWRCWVEGQYQILQPDKNGVLKSLVFPGLWLDVPALLIKDRTCLVKTLEKGLRSPEHKRFLKRKAR